ncbi:MAG TPA: hypothetical protein VFU02_11080, partial [Polyangiaceae bacterium]|nr:hypothetical protein [Polyangiaceae bacterium]
LTQLFQIGLESEAYEAHRILGEVATGGGRVLALAPSMQALMLMVARAEMYCDQPEAASQYLARVTKPDYVAPDPLDRNFLVAMVCAADLACLQNDATAATVISQRLDAYVGWHAVAAFGTTYLGPVTYWLGRLSLCCNRTEDAQRHLHLAREHSDSAGSVIYRAWSDYYLAQALPAKQSARREALLKHAQNAARDFSLGRLQSALGRSH